MKKLAKIFGVVVLVLVAAMAIIPMMVDVDKYRPQIVQAANEQINGKVELGKLTLSLWGRVYVRIDGLKISDARGKEIVEVKDAAFQLPFLSLLTGSPQLIFKMDHPQITVISDQNGKLNVMKLMKTAGASSGSSGAAAESAPALAAAAKPQAETKGKEASAPTTAAPEAPAAQAPAPKAAGGPEMPGIVARARLGVEIRDADVRYIDLAKDMKNDLKGLNLLVKDLSLSRPTEMEIWGDIDTQLGKKKAADSTSVKGPFKISARLAPDFRDGKLQKGSAWLKADFDKLEIHSGDVFHKKSGIPANAELKAVASMDQATIEQLEFHFHNIEIKGSGGATGLQAQDPMKEMALNVKLASNDIQLGPWNQLVPMLKDFDLTGSAKFAANANGTMDALKYDASFVANDWSATSGVLKAKPKIDLDVKVVTDEVQKMNLDMTAPGTSLKVRGSVKNFTAPDVKLAITSDGMDFDQWIDFSKMSSAKSKSAASQNAGKETEKAAAAPSGGSGVVAVKQLPTGKKGDAAVEKSGAVEEDSDEALAPLRESKAMRQAKVDYGMDIKSIKAMGVNVSAMKVHFGFKDLVGKLDQFGLGIFDGTVGATAAFDLKPKQPTYQLKAWVKGMNLDKAVKSQLEMFKNTVTGTLTFDMTGSGRSLNVDRAMKALDVKGNFSVKDATFSTIDVGKMTVEAVNGTLAKVGEKVPALRGKSVGGLKEFESRYSTIGGDFTMKDGVLNAPNFAARSIPGKGVDIEGATTLNMITEDLNAKWKIIDVHNMTKVRDIGVDIAGTPVPNILAEGNPPVFAIPISMSGKMTSPHYDYQSAPEYFAGVAGKRVENAGKERLKQEAAKRIQQAVPNAPPAIQNVIKKLPF